MESYDENKTFKDLYMKIQIICVVGQSQDIFLLVDLSGSHKIKSMGCCEYNSKR